MPFQLRVADPGAGGGEAGEVGGAAVVIHPDHRDQAVPEQLGGVQHLPDQAALARSSANTRRAPESCRIHSTWLAEEVS